MQRLTAVAATAFFSLVLGANAQTPPDTTAVPGAPSPAAAPTFQTIITADPSATIVANLKTSGRFTTLLKGLDASGLTAFLQQPGAFTLFAPTDEAFAALPSDTMASLLKPENAAKLQAILAYHVVNAKIAADQVIGRTSAPIATVINKPITLDGSKDGIKVNDASVLQAAAPASNGVVYVIDKVLTAP